MTTDSVAHFEKRFSDIRYKPMRADLARTFTADEVRAYIRSKARLRTDFSYPYADVLKTFPEEWWNAVVAEFVTGPKDAGASHFIEAAFELAPDIFDGAPEQVVRWLDLPAAYAWVTAHRERTIAGLERVLANANADWRWQAAAFLLLVDRQFAPRVSAVIAALDEQGKAGAKWELSEAGWDFQHGSLRALWPERTFHLAFEPDGTHAFGGVVGGYHHVMTLAPVPGGLGISLQRLVLVCDLDFAHEDGSEQYFHHDANGDVIDTPRKAEHPPFAPTRVTLVPTPPHLLVQDWGVSNGKENLFRLGGLPVFVQSASYPKCAGCERQMVHILSLDSEIPLVAPGPNRVGTWDWGSGGVANAFWCDGCRISAWMHACT